MDGASLLDESPQVFLTSVSLGTVPLQKKPSLFAEGKEESSVDTRCLLATAVITLFSVSNKEVHHGGSGFLEVCGLITRAACLEFAFMFENSAKGKAREVWTGISLGWGGCLLSIVYEETLEYGQKRWLRG